MLAIETARAGSATGEVTSVLRTLPSQTQRRVPFRIRHRAWAVILMLVPLAIVAGVVACGSPPAPTARRPSSPSPPPAAAPGPGPPVPTCAHDYNPDAISGPKNQNPSLVGLAIDGNVSTAWLTEHYYNGSLQKAGVGLYVDMSRPVAAREIVLYTADPGIPRPDLRLELAARSRRVRHGPRRLEPDGARSRRCSTARPIKLDAPAKRLPLLPGVDHVAAARQDARGDQRDGALPR